MEIYAFGSVVRGEIDEFSDIDLLMIKEINEPIPKIDKEQFSIYSYQRISKLWKEGNPFSWHLFIESRCIFTSNKISFIETLGEPNKYSNMLADLNKFYNLFIDSKKSILSNNYSIDFDLSMIFLAIRNFASCFSLGYLNKYEFSRYSAKNIGSHSIQIIDSIYNKLEQSRLLATRGFGNVISKNELEIIIEEFPEIDNWFNELLTLTK